MSGFPSKLNLQKQMWFCPTGVENSDSPLSHTDASGVAESEFGFPENAFA
jgi:hypothetical protein